MRDHDWKSNPPFVSSFKLGKTQVSGKAVHIGLSKRDPKLILICLTGNLYVKNNTLELLLTELNVALGPVWLIKDAGMIRIPLPTGHGALPTGQLALPTQIEDAVVPAAAAAEAAVVVPSSCT